MPVLVFNLLIAAEYGESNLEWWQKDNIDNYKKSGKKMAEMLGGLGSGIHGHVSGELLIIPLQKQTPAYLEELIFLNSRDGDVNTPLAPAMINDTLVYPTDDRNDTLLSMLIKTGYATLAAIKYLVEGRGAKIKQSDIDNAYKNRMSDIAQYLQLKFDEQE